MKYKFKEIVNELTTTGGEGYMSPFAFSKDKGKHSKQVMNHIRKVLQWDIVNKKVNEKQLTEELDLNDYKTIRRLIRSELSAIFFELFKKRKMWS